MRRTPLALAACALLLSACSVATDSSDDDRAEPREAEIVPGSKVVLVTHDSYELPQELVAAFEKDTGLELEVRALGDGGELTTKLVLNREHPLGDVAYGVDNTFASRALDNDVYADADIALPEGVDELLVDGDDDGRMVPVDHGSVCVNIDKTWFAEHDLTPPATLEDLTEPAYEDLLVTPGAPTSTPGLAFMLATIAEYGDGWTDYWGRLMDNGAKVVAGWEDAYGVDYTGGWGESPTRPIVVSYDTSPYGAVDPRTGRATTAALLDTCFHQVEYAGVLENAANPAAAKAVVEWLLSPEVQRAIPDLMYMYPADPATPLAEAWTANVQAPAEPYDVDPAEIDENREEWLTEWTDVTTR